MGCVGSKKGSLDITPGATEGNVEGSGGNAIGRNLPRDKYYDNHPGAHPKPKDGPQPAPMPNSQDAKTDDERQILKVISVDLQIPSNARYHRTDAYELTEAREEDGVSKAAKLVVRRGQPFDIAVTFDRPFNKKTDEIRLVFTVGTRPLESKATKVVLTLSDIDKPREWGARLLSQQEDFVILRIFTPPNCFVANWNFTFDSVLKKDDKQKVFRYEKSEAAYILFNPWCPDDQVYMDDEVSRKEYVLNDKGRVYRGTSKQISSKPWNFGQFEDFVLECIMYLLEESQLSWRCRGNPIHVVRKVSAMVNSADDGGVLVGNWSGEYAGGVNPMAWVGSVAILNQFWNTKQPVKYGQCWVFSGLVTTVCRALGIPARSVTNFASAHDCDASITIDVHVNGDGKPLEEYNADSIWNFHVWNDVWMARPDLPAGFGGWQAIDSTPQETSEGIYCCGPASVEAIKNGLVNLPHDGPFIFAEVNGDLIYWIKQLDDWKNTKRSRQVGKSVSTKGVSSADRMDITHMYKFKEGTPQERTAVWRAASEGSSRKDIYTVDVQDMTFDLIEKDNIMIGEAFDVTLKASNKANVTRTVKVTLTATVIFYTGVPVKVVKSEVYNVKAGPQASDAVTMTVKPEEYLDKLVDMAIMKITCMVQVIETNQYYCDSDDFRLLKPDLIVKAPEDVHQGEEYLVDISFNNPLSKALTKCEFEVEGAGLQRPIRIKHDVVGPHAAASVTAKLRARHVGEREVVASFDSKELSDISGVTTIKVLPPLSPQV